MSTTASTKMNPVWVASQLFIAPILCHLAFGGQQGFMNGSNFWTTIFAPYMRWQLTLATIYIPFFYWRYKSSDFLISVMTRAWLLGLGFSVGLHLVLQTLPLDMSYRYIAPLGMYLATFALYHYLEFAAIGLRNPDKVTVANFLLSYSDVNVDRPRIPGLTDFQDRYLWPGFEVHGAIIFSLIEYFTELWYFGPDLKLGLLPWLPYAGFSLCLGAEILRKSAMLTAAKNFNHFVQNTKASDHRLITGGIYALYRHPSYVGFFAWTIGTQLILVNVISLNITTLIAWAVLRNRIEREERKLVEFFGPEYLEYRRRVPSGIPFIK